MAKTINELIVLDSILSSPCQFSKFNKSGYYKIFKPMESKDLRSIRVGVDFDWAKLSDKVVVKNFEKSIEKIRNLGCQVIVVDMSKAGF